MAAAAILNLLFFVYFGQMVYFRWQPATSLQNIQRLQRLPTGIIIDGF